MSTVEDPFRRSERRRILQRNASEVRQRWPSNFASKDRDFYLCENCEFVNEDSSLFAIDHIMAQARGGTTGRENIPASAEAVANDDVEAVYRIGVNYAVLCTGCNSAKREHDMIPAGAGYAFSRPREDKNPERHRG